ncbi:Lysine biosynthesis regulatory protein LYS14 [Candida viswanathii]|uniref:Lysine biosynthesis regulatory protein LYS14 n=1 Tax=Candida viswanathii TaxID=5486 RepID=A0A367Y525_9ASCO|nr:Lysine biosynthesis regulatory protein LYS14 [Candida viswanathii]
MLDYNQHNPNSKRVYSKYGCKECKRRKIKCDEGKPFCWQCVRLRKQCAYPEPGEKVLRILKKKQTMLKLLESQLTQHLQQQQQHQHQQLLQEQATPPPSGTLPPLSSATAHHQQVPPSSSSAHTSPQMHTNGAPAHLATPIHTYNRQPAFGVPQDQLPQLQQPLYRDQIQHYRDQTQPQATQPGQVPGPATLLPYQEHYRGFPQTLPVPGTVPHQAPPPGQQQQPIPAMPYHIQQPAPPPPPPPIAYTIPQQQQQQQQVSPPTVTAPAAPPAPAPPSFYTGGSNSIVLPPPHTSRLPFNPPPDQLNKKVLYPPNAPISKPRSSGSITSLLNDSTKPNVPAGSPDSNSAAGNSPQTPHTVHTNNSQFNTSPTSFDGDLNGLYNQTDLDLLTTDLNNMVTEIMFDKNYDASKHVMDTDEGSMKSCDSGGPDYSMAKNGDNVASRNGIGSHRNLPISFIKITNSTNKVYLEAFYNEFANIILPLPSFDTTSNTYFNPARDIILESASKHKYVLAAVLANGARQRFTKTENEEDEEAYCLYLSKCLKLLGPAIAADDKKLASNIESVLLTVLLLTIGNASNLKQDWRPHLKGAKDLLLKSSVPKRKNSKIFIFCKIWFVTIEILAGISSVKGGTLQTDQEIDELISCNDEHEVKVLQELGIVLDNGFNILGGYHQDCYELFGRLMKILNRIRDGSFNSQDSFEYVKLFADFQRQSELQYIDKRGIIPNSQIHGKLVEHLDGNTISWMDVCQQGYTLGAMIFILKKCFGETYASPQVQLLSKTIYGFISYLKDYPGDRVPEFTVKNSLMMLQWPIYVAAENLTDEECQAPITRFFQVLSQVGSGGATIALKRIRKIWSKRQNNEATDEENDSEDLVAY